ncbi:MAG: redox-sensing transcriptional repressor Rex [Anaerolineae bacterium]|nr:redox-sensing transcriptional repressor Rex [Anaerolineae bacterium]
MPDTQVPDMVVARLPLYLRTLRYLESAGIEVTSSQDLAARLGVSSAQIRKDLSYFGRFGKQGTGYETANLRSQLEKILGLDRRWPMILVGAGALGQAVMHYAGFYERGFYIAHVFDSDLAKLGHDLAGFVVRPPEEIPACVRENDIRIAIVAVPSEAAQAVTDELVDAGIEAILNYAPMSLTVPRRVQVQQIDPVVHLQHMVYYLTGATRSSPPA